MDSGLQTPGRSPKPEAPSPSEQVLNPKLHLPRDRVSRARDAAKPRAPEIEVGEIEIGKVGHVVHLGSELQLASAAQRQILEDRHVDPPLVWPMHQRVPDVARG